MLIILDVQVKIGRKRVVMAEEFLRLLIQVGSSRRCISNENTLRREVLHWLAASKKITHSKLVQKLDYKSGVYDDSSINKAVEVHLKELAVYHPPQAGKQAYYELKPEYVTFSYLYTLLLNYISFWFPSYNFLRITF